MARIALRLVLGLLAGCSGPSVSAPPPPPTVVTAPSPTPPTNPPVPDCELTLRAVASTIEDGTFEVIATLSNETDAPITATWTAPCPGPGLRFDGLPVGYDYGSTCSAGACVGGPTETRTVTIAARGTATAGRIAVSPRGDACNRPLDLGRYHVGAALEVEGVRICRTNRASIVVSSPTPTTVDREAHGNPGRPQPREQRERCPAMGCAYTPCPPGVEPPTGCAAVCGCSGSRGNPGLLER